MRARQDPELVSVFVLVQTNGTHVVFISCSTEGEMSRSPRDTDPSERTRGSRLLPREPALALPRPRRTGPRAWVVTVLHSSPR